ncbi:MAG: GNAT family N-acetyltransferase [Spirochaetales bacterium]
MNWKRLEAADLPEAIRFIGEKEWVCLHLVTRLLKKERTQRIEPDWIWMGYRDGRPSGILYVSAQGLLLPYLPFLEDSPSIPLETLQPLKQSIGDKTSRIYSIVGKRTYVQAMERLFRFTEGVCVDYHLMTRSSSSPLPFPAEVPSLRIRKATTADVDRLLPLQILYEKEEVLIRPDLANPEKTRKDLILALQEQVIFLGEYEGKTVTKAGTNARGIRFEQIGGVFTDPLYRGRHFARSLMVRLLTHIHGEGKNACLFVKTRNRVALHLYEELGFQIRDAFRIHYL